MSGYPTNHEYAQRDKDWHKAHDERERARKAQYDNRSPDQQMKQADIRPPEMKAAFEAWRKQGLPKTPMPQKLSGQPEPYSNEWFAAQQKKPAPEPKHPAYDPKKAWERVAQSSREANESRAKTDAKLDDLRARTQALMEQYDPKNRLVSGGTFPKLVDLLGDTGPALRAMKHLDEIKTSPAVIYNDRRMATPEALAIYTRGLLTMADAVVHIATNSSRDLAEIVKGDKLGSNGPEVLARAQAELAKAVQAANNGKGCFKQQPPAFVAGMTALRGAVRINQNACEEVTGWSNALLKNAERNVEIAVGVRDTAVGALAMVAVGAVTAPAAIVTTVVGGATVKTALHASDFINSGKPVPWGALSGEFITDVVFSLFGKWFEEAIKPITASIPNSFAGQFLAKHGVTGRRMVEEVESAILGAQGMLTEPAKKFVETLLGERTHDEEKLTTGAYVEKRFREIFTEKRLEEVLLARLKDQVGGLAAHGASSRPGPAPRMVDEVAGSE